MYKDEGSNPVQKLIITKIWESKIIAAYQEEFETASKASLSKIFQITNNTFIFQLVQCFSNFFGMWHTSYHFEIG